ncbi:MAG: cytosolic protein, partial [Desulfobacter postgatei]
MQDSTPFQAQDLTSEMQKSLLVDMFTRIVVHYGLWFNEVQHQMGMEKALAVLDKATQSSISILMKHLSRTLEFELDQGMPKALMALDEATTEKLMAAVGKSWLANDG